MISTRRLQFTVGRVLCAIFRHQPQSAQYLVCAPNISHWSKGIPIKNCKSLCTVSDNKSEQDLDNEIEECEMPSYCEFLSQNPGLAISSEEDYKDALKKLLNCREEESKKILEENIFWKNFPINKIIERIKVYKELGVHTFDLVDHSTLLFVDFEYYYELLNSLCSTLNCNGHELFPMLFLPEHVLHGFLIFHYKDSEHLGDHENRIKYFSTKLKVPVRQLTEVLEQHLFLLRVDMSKISRMMDLLLGNGVSEEYLSNYFWVFKVREEELQLRLAYCKKAGLTKIHPSLLTALPGRFFRLVEIHKKEQFFDKRLSWTEFVAQSLNLSVEEAKTLSKSDKRVKTLRFSKTKDVIDLLLSEGFTPKQIVQSPQVFMTSLGRLKKRIKTLKKAGLKPEESHDFLRRTAYTDKLFMECLARHIKSTATPPQTS